MRTVEECIKARKKLHKLAVSYKKKGRSSYAFTRFISDKWPTVNDRVNDKELKHLIALVWSD